MAFIAVNHWSAEPRLCRDIDEFGMERQAGWFPARGRRDASGGHSAVLLGHGETGTDEPEGNCGENLPACHCASIENIKLEIG
jgi:hypothetical protein